MDRFSRLVWPLVLLAHAVGASRVGNQQHSLRQDVGLRRLMQTVPGVQPEDTSEFETTAVGSAAQFAAAVASGAAHIEVQAHIDLTSLELSGDTALGALPSSVKSIRGNCPGAVPDLGLSGATMLPLQPQQCVVITDRRITDTAPDSDMLWVDGLYLRYQRSPAVQEYNAGLIDTAASTSGKVFLTSVTMQGDADGEKDCGACAVRVGGQMYAEDCTFSDFEGDMLVHTGSGDSVAFQGCTFTDNAAEFAVLTGWSATLENGGLVKIQSSAFEGNAAPSVLQAREWVAGEAPIFFSDTPLTLMTQNTNGGASTTTQSSSLEDYPASRPALAAEDNDLAALKAGLPVISRTTVTPVTTPLTAPAVSSTTAAASTTATAGTPATTAAPGSPAAASATTVAPATSTTLPPASSSGAATVTSPVSLTPSASTSTAASGGDASAQGNGAIESAPNAFDSSAEEWPASGASSNGAIGVADTDPGSAGVPGLEIPNVSVISDMNEVEPGSRRKELPKGLLMFVSAVLLSILLVAGIIALVVSLRRSRKERESHDEWDDYMERKKQAVPNVAIPKQPNTYVPPDFSDNVDCLEAASPAATLPPRPPSFYAASLGNVYGTPLRPASQGRYVPSHLFPPHPEICGQFDRTDSGHDSYIASSSSGGQSATGQKLLP